MAQCLVVLIIATPFLASQNPTLLNSSKFKIHWHDQSRKFHNMIILHQFVKVYTGFPIKGGYTLKFAQWNTEPFLTVDIATSFQNSLWKQIGTQLIFISISFLAPSSRQFLVLMLSPQLSPNFEMHCFSLCTLQIHDQVFEQD